MKKIHTIIFLLLALVMTLSSCAPSPAAEQTPTVISPSLTSLPDPVVHTTQTPPVIPAARSYLDSWKANDYDSMYANLTSASQQNITPEAYRQKFENVAQETALKEVRYEILGQTAVDQDTTQVNYRLTLASNLIGDLSRDNQLTLKLEDGRWRVQYDDASILPELAGGSSLRMDLNPPTRASIFDRSGNLLAGQADATSIGLMPDYIDPENADGLFGLLSRASGLTPAEIRARVENSSPGDYIPLGQVGTQESSNLLAALARYGAVVLTNYTSRFYPNNGVAPHLVGYVRALDQEELAKYRRLGYRPDEKVGRKGVERWGEDTLIGKHGGILYQLDPQGVPMAELGSSAAEPGNAIYTTIDRDFQAGVQEALRGFNGAAVVMEKDTGRVLAMASSPGFDQNSFQVENYNWWATLPGVVNDLNLPEFNRASQGLYPLGSVFKIITMAAALESGLYPLDYNYDCQYIFDELPGLPLNDWTYTHYQEDGETPPTGMLHSIGDGLIRSCNPLFWHLGKGLFDAGKTTAVSDMARKFGLGSKTGIEVVEEQAGNILDPQNVIEAVNNAIGQGDVQVTPLQVARFISALGNGGTLYRPQAVEKIVKPDGTVTFEFKPEAAGTLGLKPETLKAIQDAMLGVARSKNPRGTAYLVFNGFNTPVHGKTGTATSQTNDPHAWFAGYTAAGRTDKPDIAIAVVAENAGEGSEIAAPIFRRIVELYFQGRPARLYPWESSIGVTKTPTSLYTETPTPEVTEEP